MLILNFAHPLTDENRAQIEAFAGMVVDEIRTISIHIDQAQALETQICVIVDAVHLSSQEWQTCSLLINLPGYAPVACMLLAELHGRIGHFPSLIRLRPKSGPVSSYEVAEFAGGSGRCT